MVVDMKLNDRCEELGFTEFPVAQPAPAAEFGSPLLEIGRVPAVPGHTQDICVMKGHTSADLNNQRRGLVVYFFEVPLYFSSGLHGVLIITACQAIWRTRLEIFLPPEVIRTFTFVRLSSSAVSVQVIVIRTPQEMEP